MDTRIALLLVKGLILIALLSQLRDVDMPIWLGEMTALSAEGDGNAASKQEPNGKSEAAGTSAKKKERSLIDDLLYLPKLDRESVTKDQLARYLDMLDRKKLKIESTMANLKSEHTRIKGLEREVEGKIDKLQEELKFFQQTVQKEKDFSEERLAKLIEFYKKVPPKKSAPVFESLDKDLVVALFNGLPKKQVTKILALMNPEKSVEITEYYGRITSAKEYLLLQEINKELADTFKKCSELQPSP